MYKNIIISFKERLKKSSKFNRFYFFLYETINNLKSNFNKYYSNKVDLPIKEHFKPAFERRHFSFYSIIHFPLGWKSGQIDFRPAYSGSSDRVIFNKVLSSNDLKFITDSFDTTLLTVIGGAFFVDLVSKFNFREVILFDKNVNEHVKISSLLNSLMKSYDFATFESEVLSDNKSLVPFLSNSILTFKQLITSEIRYSELSGREQLKEKSFPLIELSQNFPHYRLPLDESSINEVLDRLSYNLDKNIYYTIPSFDARGRVVVVFASNIDKYELSNIMIKNAITNAKGIFIVRGDENQAISGLMDANQYWKAYTYPYLIKKNVLHVVHNKNYSRRYKNDEFYSKTISIGQKVNYSEFNVVFLHILLGHTSKFKNTINKMKKLFSDLPKEIDQVIVTEKTNLIDNKKLNYAWDTDMTLDFYKRFLKSYVFVEKIDIPGNGSSNRNMLLVFKRKLIVQNVKSKKFEIM